MKILTKKQFANKLKKLCLLHLKIAEYTSSPEEDIKYSKQYINLKNELLEEHNNLVFTVLGKVI